MQTIIWAGDPGANGAFVRFISPTEWNVYVVVKGYYDVYMRMCSDARIYGGSLTQIVGCVEDLAMRKGDLKKAASISAMLKNSGRMLLCYELAGIRYEEIPPATWQYDFGLVGMEYNDRKRKAKEIAAKYFGSATLADADAKLIALHKYWKLNGIAPPRKAKEIITELTITKEIIK